MSLGDTIRLLRQQQNWTQSKLSQESGIPQPTIWRLERGIIKQPKMDMLQKLASVFNISLDKLSQGAKQMSFEELKGDPEAEVLFRGYQKLDKQGRDKLSSFAQWLVDQDNEKEEKKKTNQ